MEVERNGVLMKIKASETCRVQSISLEKRKKWVSIEKE